MRESKAVADLFKGLHNISATFDPYVKEIYVTKREEIKVKRTFWQWLFRVHVEAYKETTVTLRISRDGFITHRLRSASDIPILKEMIAPVLDKNDVFMLVEVPIQYTGIDFEKIPGIAYLYP